MAENEPDARDKPTSSSPLRVAAVQLHELFTTLVDSGFSEDQALRLTAYISIGKRDQEDGSP